MRRASSQMRQSIAHLVGNRLVLFFWDLHNLARSSSLLISLRQFSLNILMLADDFALDNRLLPFALTLPLPHLVLRSNFILSILPIAEERIIFCIG